MIFLFVFCCFINVKGIVHPKIKVLSSVCQFCQSVLCLYHHLLKSCVFVSSAEHKYYFEERGKPNSFWSTVTYIGFFSYYQSQCGRATVRLHILQNISFCVQHKKIINTGLGHVSE